LISSGPRKSALRRETATTYRQAINFGEVVAPSLLAKENRILLGARESKDARLYAELALAESARTGVPTTREEFIRRRIAQLREGIETSQLELGLAELELERLQRVLLEITPKKYTENRLIMRDAKDVERQLPVSGNGQDYKEYQLDGDRYFRIRVLHPDLPEHKIGADLIYEVHDLDNETVRVSFVQYKLWNGKALRFDDRMGKQLAKLRSVGCDGVFCSHAPVSGVRPPYRFPHCSVFLRPTDELQGRDSRYISSGLHVPLCVADGSWTQGPQGGRVLRKTNVEKQSIDHGLFEDLFYLSFLGSRELPASDLEQAYKQFKVLDDDESLVIHGQEYIFRPDKPVKKKRSKTKEAG
jgi:hypothetical protein